MSAPPPVSPSVWSLCRRQGQLEHVALLVALDKFAHGAPNQLGSRHIAMLGHPVEACIIIRINCYGDPLHGLLLLAVRYCHSYT